MAFDSSRGFLILAPLLLAASASSAAELFVKPTGSGSACTQSAPCALATALAGAGGGDRILVAAGAYTGSGSEVALVDRGVELLGGWNGAPAGAVVRDAVAYESVIDGEHARRGVKIVAAGATLDGFTVTNGNANGQIADCGNGGATDGCGGGILVAADDVTISNNRIAGNVAATAPAAGLQRIGHGGGVMAYLASGLVLEANTVTGNVAHTGNSGIGGAPTEIPLAESLRDTVERFLPYWHGTIAPELRAGRRVIVVAHGNSLRALVKYLDGISDEEIVGLNIPTGIPLVYDLDEALRPRGHEYLGDPEAARRAAEAVAEQARRRV